MWEKNEKRSLLILATCEDRYAGVGVRGSLSRRTITHTFGEFINVIVLFRAYIMTEIETRNILFMSTLQSRILMVWSSQHDTISISFVEESSPREVQLF